MGIWETLQWTADGLKSKSAEAASIIQSTADGLKSKSAEAASIIQSTADGLKSRTPDVPPIKEVYTRAHGSISTGSARALDLLHSASIQATTTASKIDHTLRAAMPDRDGWDKIGRISFQIADLYLAEATKPITGGIPVYKMARNGWREEEDKAVKMGNDADLQELRRRVEMAEAKLARMEETTPATANWYGLYGDRRKPEEVISMFMMLHWINGGDCAEKK